MNDDSDVTEAAIQEKQKATKPAGPTDVLPIVVAATFVAEPLEPPLSWILQALRISATLRFAPYNQIFQQLLTPASELARNTAGINVLLVRMEDFVRDRNGSEGAREAITSIETQLSDALEHFSGGRRNPLVLVILPPGPNLAADLASLLAQAGARIAGRASSLPAVHVLSEDCIDVVSSDGRYDLLRDQLAHIPYSDSHFGALALAIARRIHAVRVPPAKVLVLDCDNTLWHGVVGEDGVSGISITDAFAAMQEFAVLQQEKGILVCLASKNSEADVLQVLDERDDMKLKRKHVVSHRINWNSKAANLRSLASELNLGLDAFVFLDDNPLECAQVRAELPQVVTLQVPAEPDIPSFLRNIWILDKLGTTAEDAGRTRMYRENAARKALESSARDIGEFIATLGLEIDVAVPAAEEWPRIEQLTQRTNQFNFTTRRRSVLELKALAARGAYVSRVRVSDRFGDYGLVGVLIAEPDSRALQVDTFLLSCRVLGRGVEHAMLRQLGAHAASSGLEWVALPYLRTDRNVPARAFADSVVSEFGVATHDGIVYRIPAGRAASVEHRPGHDPAEIMQALASENDKAPPAASSASISRSETYSLFASVLTSGRALVEAARGRRARTLAQPAVSPTSDIEAGVLRLMEDVLEMDGLGIDDDYFDLGGTSLLSVKLFAEIERRFQRPLRLTAILDAPTARALAALIASSNDRDGVVSLRSGGDTNLFLVHDGLGETLLYLHLARRLPTTMSIYGIEPRRLPGIPLAHARMEDMAACYVEQIRKIQPKGPYLLGGMCAGGTIAYEMAVCLTGAGERVRMVVVMDGATPQASKRAGRITRNRLSRLQDTLAQSGNSVTGISSRIGRWVSIMPKVLGKARNVIAHESRALIERIRMRSKFRLLRRLVDAGGEWPVTVPPLNVMQIYNLIESRYRPRPLSGVPLLLIRAGEGQGADTPYREIYQDEYFGWRAVAGNVRPVDVTGGHASMLQEHAVDSLVNAIVQGLASPAGASNSNRA
jgi:FkbH-like protein